MGAPNPRDLPTLTPVATPSLLFLPRWGALVMMGAHKTGDLAHKTGGLAHKTGDLAHKKGDLAHKTEPSS